MTKTKQASNNLKIINDQYARLKFAWQIFENMKGGLIKELPSTLVVICRCLSWLWKSFNDNYRLSMSFWLMSFSCYFSHPRLLKPQMNAFKGEGEGGRVGRASHLRFPHGEWSMKYLHLYYYFIYFLGSSLQPSVTFLSQLENKSIKALLHVEL